MNEQAFKDWVTTYTTPITNALLWILPILAVISALIGFVSWLGKSENEREQQPWFKPLKNLMIGLLVAESIIIIFKIFGLS